MPVPTSTLTGVASSGGGRGALWSRRAFITALVLFVLAGATGLLGVRTTTSSASGAGYELSLRHATLARAGFDVPWQVTVTHDAGYTDDVTLAVTGSYFDIYETQGFSPEPSDTTRDGSTLYLTFAQPPGDTLVVSYDAYIQPSSQLGRSGTLSVVDQGERLVSVDFSTTLLP